MLLLSSILRKFLKRRSRRIVAVIPGDPTGVDLAEDLPMLVTRSKPVIFDVGANVGQSIELFRGLFQDAIIHSFEPSPDCLAALAQKKWDARITIHPMALGSKSEENVLHRYEISVLNSILPLERESDHQFSEVQEVGRTTVQTDTLDNVARTLGVDSIDLLKIDTQGFDYQVLQGAGALLEEWAVRVVMVELNFISIYQRQSSAMQIQGFLNRHGFQLVDFYEKFRHGSALAWCTAVFMRR